MSGRIPQPVLDEILRKVEIGEIVGEYVSLTRAGRNLKGLCPFHQEKTPSFMVSPDRQAYHCFGCGAGGNAIKFVMEFEKTSFPEAVAMLARRAGVSLPERVEASPEERRENDRIHEALAFAREFYAAKLAEKGAGARARAYLVERGLGRETASTFGIGFAPASWDALLSGAKRRGMVAEALLAAGLARAREDGSGHYDYFRDRLIFPIVGSSGRVIGFGGRSMDGSEPKYLNSPETAVFRKGSSLYGLVETKNEIRNTRVAVVVEGYMDFLLLYEHGSRNTVAPLGTAFTADHARILARYAPAAVLAYDGDEAGRRAAWLAAPLLWEAGLRVNVATLPPGEDPDSFVRAHGAAAWGELLAAAPDFAAHALAGAGTMAEREEALARLVSALAGIRDEVRRELYLRNVASLAGMNEETLAAAVRTEIRRREGRMPREEAPATAAPAQPGARGEDPGRELLRLLLSYPELQHEFAPELSPELFDSEEHRELARRVLSAAASGRPLGAGELLASEAGPAAAAARVLVEREIDGLGEPEEEGEAARLRRRAVRDYLDGLRARERRRSLEGLEEETRRAQTRGDVGEALDLLRRTLEIKRKDVGLGGKNPEGMHI